ncbi:LuxR C-terminal-related transcriptional regulator [Rubellimicrobium aerolatum]|uniref:LuxR C-terminal-related transcriptional regulator n=1 Tax=Rubellimicrobium aerolatum TaxID=490979 RepID=A0ABW0SEB1_9RHOB|nr:response regulator transcription factor [Rubellimicrobium aerolatum]MBP1806799.1 DNA-binding NarL/FixJ family response regulator [Rubellimicrobium aerolatum]
MNAKLFGGLARSDGAKASVVVARPAPPPAAVEEAIAVAVIDPRTLDRECLVRTISSSSAGVVATGYGSVEAWLQSGDVPPAKIILYRIGGSAVGDPGIADGLQRLVREAGSTPVMVVGDSEDVREMIAAFDHGARGYIPSSVGLETIVEATRLSLANGVFLPMTSLHALRSAFVSAPKQPQAEQFGQFTERQLAVCEALRRGKSNKTIAYELNLCESTVKVHIRSIMKKLHASNRTEAAFKLNAVCFGSEG